MSSHSATKAIREGVTPYTIEEKEEYLNVYQYGIVGICILWVIVFRVLYGKHAMRKDPLLWVPFLWVPCIFGLQLHGIRSSKKFAQRMTDRQLMPMLHEESQNIAGSIFSIVTLMQAIRPMTKGQHNRHTRHLLIGLTLLICIASPVLYVPNFTPLSAIVRAIQQGGLHFALSFIATATLDMQAMLKSN